MSFLVWRALTHLRRRISLVADASVAGHDGYAECELLFVADLHAADITPETFVVEVDL